jgi:putative ABC transport system permease protein
MSQLASSRWLLLALAIQNLSRRKTRTCLLIAAIAVSSAVTFAGVVVMRSLVASMQVGLSRVGADLMIVNQGALTNITTALLTVEPTDRTVPVDAVKRAGLLGIARVTAQRILRTDQSGIGGPGELVDLIGFDAATDFTVQPWLDERLSGGMGAGDVIVGAARDLPLGSQLVLFGQPFRIYGKLSPTGSGTQERGVFMASSSLIALAPAIRQRTGTVPPMLDADKVTGFLIEMAPGTTELQTRFALLSKVPDVKVVVGGSLMTGIRQGLVALLEGLIVLVALMSASTAVMVIVLFSAIMAERRRELGLLKAIGARNGQIVGMAVAEAAIATAGGGALGVLVGLLLLRMFERALVFHLSEMGIPFLWLDRPSTLCVAALCVAGAALVGVVGATIPAWRMGRRETYDLLWKEG